nr:tRNA pseudouridine(65) synthase TruC [uncultured Ferrimonas sp.]
MHDTVRIRLLLTQIQSQLQQQHLWQLSPPSDEALASTAPFCCDTLGFEQWLQFVLLPRLTALLDSEGTLPTKVAIAPMAEEAFKGQPQLQPLLHTIATLDAALSMTLQPTIEVIYEDEHIVAVHKPSGLLVHRSWLARKETEFAMQKTRDTVGCHVFTVHRLDRPTSGVLLFAKSSEVARTLSEMFANHHVEKRYLALCRGFVDEGAVLDYPLKEELDKIADKFADQDKEPQEAISRYQPLRQGQMPFPVSRYPSARYTLMELEPITGRKHQLRRHMAHLRHPIVGDTTHGCRHQNQLFRDQFELQRLWLICKSMSFDHPVTGERLTIETELEADWQQPFAAMGWDD